MEKTELLSFILTQRNTKMSGTHYDLYRLSKDVRDAHKNNLLRLRAYALELLREALKAAVAASEATQNEDPKKVWRTTYEAVIASAPVNIRDMANVLRDYKGPRATNCEA